MSFGIFKNRYVVTEVFKNISSIYKGAKLIWVGIYEAIRSCFSSGIWRSNKPWLGNEFW